MTYYEEHREEVLARQKQYYQDNKGERLERQKQYYQDNKGERLERCKEYRDARPLRMVWHDIKKRCYNPKYKGFKNYGGRNITMCQEWLDSFEVFEEWCLNNGWKNGLEIDRKNNDNNYEPSNCQFLTSAQNLAIGKKRKQVNNSTGYTGVTFRPKLSKYIAQIYINKKNIYLGSFNTIEEALAARIAKEIELFGEQKTNLNLGET